MTTIGDEVTSERLEEMLATLNGPRDEAFAWPTEFSCAEPEMRSIVSELLSRRSTAVGSTPSEGEVAAHFDTLDSCLESFWCSTNEGSDNRILADQAIASAKSLRAAAQVRANSEGDGGAVKGLAIEMLRVAEAADGSSAGAKELLRAGAAALSLQPVTGEGSPSQALRDRVAVLERERDELQEVFDSRWNADMRAIKRWQEANPGNDLVWPDHADLVLWLEAELATSRAALRPFAEFAPYVDMFVEGRAAQGGSPVLPTKHFTRAHFEVARAALNTGEPKQ